MLQVDGYDGFKRLAEIAPMPRCGWRFAGRICGGTSYEFYDLHEITARRGRARTHPRALRDRNGRSGVIPLNTEGRCGRSEVGRLSKALYAWLQDHLGRVSAISDLAKAMRYTLRHWSGLVVFLDDGRVEMDTNVVERAIRPNTLTRKNALFAGSDGGARHWAIAMTLIQTAKLNGVDPMAWLTGCPCNASCRAAQNPTN